MEKRVLSAEENSVLKKMFIGSHLVFTCFNMTKMEANGFTICITWWRGILTGRPPCLLSRMIP